MPEDTGRSLVDSHTQYTHRRFRCRRCGAAVPEEAVEGGLCVNCEQFR